ncbi:hypothetical protein, partial [Aeromonas sp.]|uniref:hypothetical protein n=1 Tax=Aeromonas sp. TaxID=647 RepID=UPI00257D9644
GSHWLPVLHCHTRLRRRLSLGIPASSAGEGRIGLLGGKPLGGVGQGQCILLAQGGGANLQSI